MRLLATACSLVLISQISAAAPQAQTSKASLEGVVTRADTGQPVVGAQVEISISAMAQRLPAARNTTSQIAPETTDAEGRYKFSELEPGTYVVFASANGYIRQAYGQRSLAQPFALPVVLNAGERLQGVSIKISPTGAITGRVIDDVGQPAIGVPVYVLKYSYNGTATKTVQQIAMEKVNDRGEYRVYGLTPGRYYIAIGSGPGTGSAGTRGGLPTGRGTTNAVPAINYSLRYFPGVSEIEQAASVEVSPGGEAIANANAVRQKVYTVRGRVEDSTGTVQNNVPQPGGRAINWSMTSTSFSGAGNFNPAPNYDPSTGRFEIMNVSPGSYVLRVQPNAVANAAGNTASPQDRRASQLAVPSAEVPIIIKGSDVEGVVVTLAIPFSINGRIVVEGRKFSDIPGTDRLRVVPFSGSTVGSPQQPVPVGSDGTFVLTGMRPSDYRFSVGVPEGYYVKSMRYDNMEFTGRAVKIAEAGNAVLEVVIDSKAGQVQGVIIDAKMQPVAGVQAVLIPSNRDRVDLYYWNGFTDQTGRYSEVAVVPGDYKVFAWDGIEPFNFFDPDFMKLYEAKGKSVHIGESTVVNADIQVIPVL